MQIQSWYLIVLIYVWEWVLESRQGAGGFKYLTHA